jgi:hypothetical protein
MVLDSSLFSPGSIYETVASFDLANLSISFDSRSLPVTDFQQQDMNSVDLNEASGWMTLLDNVPIPVIAHELSHALQTATTPGGLKDFFDGFAANFFARMVIEDVVTKVKKTIPLGLRSTDVAQSEAYQRAVALQESRAIRIGGLSWPSNDTVALEQLNARYPDLPLFTSADDRGSITVNLLGSRHIYEGFGAAVEIIRAALDNDAPPDLPPNPYSICLAQYARIRGNRDGYRGTLYEFAIVLDTALLEDPWYRGEVSARLPARVFLDLLGTLRQNPELTLESMSPEHVASFQNDLMRLAGLKSRNVKKVCDEMRQALPGIIEEIGTATPLAKFVLDDYYNCIDTAQRFRMEEFGGACPLEALVFSSREFLGAIMSWLPSGRNGPIELPFVEGETEYRAPFEYLKAKHIGPILEEIIFGARACTASRHCALPSRPACAGVTGDMMSQPERCPRESVIADVMSAWQIDGFTDD